MSAIVLIYRDTDDTGGNAANTTTIGAIEGDASNLTGQIPGNATRRDAHGMAITLDRRYVHQADRVQNVVEVIDTASMTRTYDLTSANGLQVKATVLPHLYLMTRACRRMIRHRI